MSRSIRLYAISIIIISSVLVRRPRLHLDLLLDLLCGSLLGSLQRQIGVPGDVDGVDHEKTVLEWNKGLSRGQYYGHFLRMGAAYHVDQLSRDESTHCFSCSSTHISERSTHTPQLACRVGKNCCHRMSTHPRSKRWSFTSFHFCLTAAMSLPSSNVMNVKKPAYQSRAM